MLKLSLIVLIVWKKKVEDELKLRQAVVEPLRTMFVASKEVLQEPFCTEIGVSCSGQKELVCCWKCISMNIVPVHRKCIYRKGLIDQNWENIKWKSVTENVSQTYPDWNVNFGPLEIESDINLSSSYPVCQ